MKKNLTFEEVSRVFTSKCITFQDYFSNIESNYSRAVKKSFSRETYSHLLFFLIIESNITPDSNNEFSWNVFPLRLLFIYTESRLSRVTLLSCYVESNTRLYSRFELSKKNLKISRVFTSKFAGLIFQTESNSP